MCGLVKRSSLLYLISSEKGTCTWHLQLSETENGAWSKAGGLPFQDLGTGKCVALFSGLVGPKYRSSQHPSPPHPAPPTLVASGTQFAPRYTSISQAPTCLQKVSEDRLEASRMFLPTSLLSVQKLLWKPGAGLGCCWGTHRQVFLDGNQCLVTNCQGTSGRNWRGVGRKKKPKHQGEKKDKTKTSLTSPFYRQGYQEYHL